MIARIWQGRTRPGMGKAYYHYLEQTGLKEYREGGLSGSIGSATGDWGRDQVCSGYALGQHGSYPGLRRPGARVRGLLSRRQPLFPGARVGALHEALRRAASVLVGDRLFLQLVLLRLLRHAGSRVLVRENRAGEIAINYRGQRLRVRELSFSSPAMGRGTGAAPSTAPPSPKLKPRLAPASHHPWRQGWQQMKTPAFSWAW